MAPDSGRRSVTWFINFSTKFGTHAATLGMGLPETAGGTVRFAGWTYANGKLKRICPWAAFR
ncbi:MAG: hypothetical protein ACR2HJ_08395 [Fimbriimonadales bacterium]